MVSFKPSFVLFRTDSAINHKQMKRRTRKAVYLVGSIESFQTVTHKHKIQLHENILIIKPTGCTNFSNLFLE